MEHKICVYAIAKNESKFVDRWYSSMREADYICVLDTGSTDDTYEKLVHLGVFIKKIDYDKDFRFDTARNESMKMIPDDADICICTDLDEVLSPGWADIVKKFWSGDVDKGNYKIVWNYNADGSEGVVYRQEKIHRRDKFVWKYPIHEVLVPVSSEPYKTIEIPIEVYHHADDNKSRSNYLPLLELCYKEYPDDPRSSHYLGREYMFYGQYEKAIDLLKQHVSMPNSTWDVERAASLRFIAKCYKMLGNIEKQTEYLLKAILEKPDIREPYYDLAVSYYEQKDYLKSALYFTEMLKIKDRFIGYISSPECWSSKPYDYLSMCYYYLEDYNKAILNVDIAISMCSDNRLKTNREIFAQKLKRKNKSSHTKYN